MHRDDRRDEEAVARDGTTYGGCEGRSEPVHSEDDWIRNRIVLSDGARSRTGQGRHATR